MDTLLTLLNIPAETQNVEFKRLGEEKVVKKTIETIVAMANTDGGFIVLGIDDPEKTNKKGINRIYGIEENEDIYDAIGREVQRIVPPMSNIWPPDLISEQTINKRIALLRIPKASESFYSIDNHVFIRQQRSNKKLTPQEVVKFNYAKGFEKADKELVDVDFELLNTQYYQSWKTERKLPNQNIDKVLFNTGLARKDENDNKKLKPARAAVLLFAEYPTNLMETKCAIRVYKYKGTIEKFERTPNLIGVPKTIDGPVIKLIKDAHQYILGLLESGVEIHSGFITKYKIPERAVKEAITNAVIHRDYHIKRDIEVSIFEDRIEILSPGLFPYNITKGNIGNVRADGYRNDILVKHLREFPEKPNLDRNEGIQAMRNEMGKNNLYPPIFFTYPYYEDSVKVILLNEERPSEWETVKEYLKENKYINNTKAREITKIIQTDKMSKLFKRWVNQGLLDKIVPKTGGTKNTRYKLSNTDDL